MGVLLTNKSGLALLEYSGTAFAEQAEPSLYTAIACVMSAFLQAKQIPIPLHFQHVRGVQNVEWE